MGNRIDLTGQVFNHLTVLSKADNTLKGKIKWLCRCVCGNQTIVQGSHLTTSHTKSCGCKKAEGIRSQKVTHGCASSFGKTSEYNIWVSMRNRCTNPNRKEWMRYGGRGIKVCDRWMNSFQNFIDDVGLKPGPKYTLDRFPNNDGNYEPGNVMWRSYKQQAGNTRRNVWIEYNGKRMIISDWAIEVNIPAQTIARRINKLKWDPVKAITTPIDKTKGPHNGRSLL